MPLQLRNRKAAAAAIATAIAIPAEGLYHFAYYDPPGILSVCYGSTTDVQKGRFYTTEECKARLNADMAKAVDIVERCAPGLPPHVLAAFADAVYNSGPKIACDREHSTAARLLYSGRVADACNQLPRWDKSNVGGVMVSLPGLTKRRLAEQRICLGGGA